LLLTYPSRLLLPHLPELLGHARNARGLLLAHPLKLFAEASGLCAPVLPHALAHLLHLGRNPSSALRLLLSHPFELLHETLYPALQLSHTTGRRAAAQPQTSGGSCGPS